MLWLKIKLEPYQKKRYIDKRRWYVVDLRDYYKPKLLHNHYVDEQSARNAIQQGLYNNTKRYDVISGKEALKHGFKFKKDIDRKRRLNPEPEKKKVLKYSYPKERLGKGKRQKRKTYRTIQRRKLKRMLKNNTV